MDIPPDIQRQIKDMCRDLIIKDRKLTSRDATRFPTIPYNEIQHIYRTTHHEIESFQENSIKAKITSIIKRFEGGESLDAISESEDIMLPVFLRIFLRYRYKTDGKGAMDLFNNPSQIPEQRVRDTVVGNNCYGVSDMIKHDHVRMTSGLEYEYILKEYLRNLGIPFKSENTARLEGLSKTPDVVLQFPVFIKTETGWTEINWIESKALYGEAYWQSQHKDQLYSYVNRLGPGSRCHLNIDWFGFERGVLIDDRIVLLSSLPSKVHTLANI